jgi:hypothetical protein
MQRFKSPGSAQRFELIHAAVFTNAQRHLTCCDTLRVVRHEVFRTWEAATAAEARAGASRLRTANLSACDSVLRTSLRSCVVGTQIAPPSR